MIKLCRGPTSENSDLCELKMAFFDKVNPEKFLLFVQNFKIMLEASGTIAVKATQYLRTLLHCEALSRFDNFSD